MYNRTSLIQVDIDLPAEEMYQLAGTTFINEIIYKDINEGDRVVTRQKVRILKSFGNGYNSNNGPVLRWDQIAIDEVKPTRYVSDVVSTRDRSTLVLKQNGSQLF